MFDLYDGIQLLRAMKNLNAASFPPLTEPLNLSVLYANCLHFSELRNHRHQISHIHTHHELIFCLDGEIFYKIEIKLSV